MTQSLIKIVSRSHLQVISERLEKLYGKDLAPGLLERLYFLIGRYGVNGIQSDRSEKWDESDVVLITYADNVKTDNEAPLKTLERFCRENIHGTINTVHILPFCPWSSDDGFSVKDYREVEPEYGTWKDVQDLGENFELMFDLVLNHCSSQSRWFRDFQTGIQPARHYFVEMNPKTDLTEVVRPRTTPLLTPAQTREGKTHVWTTFSADQVDLNWQNPDVLFEFLDILLQYIANGCRIVRLDAVAFLCKIPGTNCLHLEETHEIVKLLRDFVDIVAPEVILLTETNVPHEENISYFGNGSDEAHMVYQFSLPPLLLHGLLEENARHLREWAESLPELPETCTFFNFTASHDGIGVRPLQGILPHEEILELAETLKSKGGRVSARTMPDGSSSPYELNITYLSALDEPKNPELGMQRFLCSQALAMSMKGVPAIYFQSLIGAENDYEGLEATGRNRTINRKKWNEFELGEHLADPSSRGAKIFARLKELLQIRATEPAFHPNASQEILNYGDSIFALHRESLDLESKVLCIYNFSGTLLQLAPMNQPMQILTTGETWESGYSYNLQPYQALWLRYS